jgi:hypothetical protein
MLNFDKPGLYEFRKGDFDAYRKSFLLREGQRNQCAFWFCKVSGKDEERPKDSGSRAWEWEQSPLIPVDEHGKWVHMPHFMQRAIAFLEYMDVVYVHVLQERSRNTGQHLIHVFRDKEDALKEEDV